MKRDTAESTSTDATLLDVLNLMLRRQRLLAFCGIVGGVVFAGVALLVPPTYVASTAFVQAEPSRGALSGNLGDIAARFGVTGSIPGTLTLDFLREAVTSRDVLDSVLTKPLVSDLDQQSEGSHGREPVDLISWLHVRDNTPAKRLDHARRLILKRMSATADQRSGIVRVTVGLRDPNVAAVFLRSIIGALNDFYMHTRQTSSRANRIFLESRVADAQNDLRNAEAALRTFYQRNRRLADSPELLFEENRLKRQVDLAQQIYVTLSQSLEQARIDEIKDTPLITIIETAQPPVRRSSPKRVVLTLMGVFVGVAIALLVAALSAYLHSAAAMASPAWREFEQRVSRLPIAARIVHLLTTDQNGAASRTRLAHSSSTPSNPSLPTR